MSGGFLSGCFCPGTLEYGLRRPVFLPNAREWTLVSLKLGHPPLLQR